MDGLGAADSVAVVIIEHDGYQLDDDPGRIDADAAWDFLSTEAYWARDRTRDELAAQLKSAWRLVGVYEAGSGRMVGLARAFSDGVSTAYLADVYVLRAARGHGLGKELVRTMIDRGPGAGFRWMLHTKDAHGLYRQFGFAGPDERFMERPKRTLQGYKEVRHVRQTPALQSVLRYTTVRDWVDPNPCRLCLPHHHGDRVRRGGMQRVLGRRRERETGEPGGAR